MAPQAMEVPGTQLASLKGRTSPKSSKSSMVVGKKLADGKTASRTGDDQAAKRPPAKTPLAALLGRNQVKSGDGNLMLVTVTVLGSPGPIRFLVDRADAVSRVVELALRAYTREGRLPLLHSKMVELYCDNGDFKALDPSELVGSLGTRQFLLYRKKPEDVQDGQGTKASAISHPIKHWWSFMSSLVCSH